MHDYPHLALFDARTRRAVARAARHADGMATRRESAAWWRLATPRRPVDRRATPTPSGA